MPNLRISIDSNEEIGTILVDNAIKGGISKTSKGTYTVETSGRLPVIDGLSGSSVRNVADRIRQEVQKGSVFLQERVDTAPED